MRSPVGEGRSFRSRAMGAENTIPAQARIEMRRA